MAKMDRLKEELANLRFWLGVIVGTFLAIAGWTATNVFKAEYPILIIAFVSLTLLMIATFFVSFKIRKKIKEIGDEK